MGGSLCAPQRRLIVPCADQSCTGVLGIAVGLGAYLILAKRDMKDLIPDHEATRTPDAGTVPEVDPVPEPL